MVAAGGGMGVDEGAAQGRTGPEHPKQSPGDSLLPESRSPPNARTYAPTPSGFGILTNAGQSPAAAVWWSRELSEVLRSSVNTDPHCTLMCSGRS
ncbi:hypothetical protein Q5P01_011658 [Channa striata]|uniref:Uncharacterized protein n=1 Tax=Channa striata TaxID=64152 RepID=A0AA88MUS7_CHASR|nr:hypothetical protein Q5P01_011658 [Channa striata]